MQANVEFSVNLGEGIQYECAVSDISPWQMKNMKTGYALTNLREILKANADAVDQSVMVFALDHTRVGFYELGTPLFGKDVANKFPSIAHDVEKSGKCYACDLPTASAFHALRCLEAGVMAVARCLGISDPIKGSDRNWLMVRRKIEDAINSRWPVSTGCIGGDAQSFDEVCGALAAIENPYRNATMDLEGTYTSSEALHLFHLVKGLMEKIAVRMDENGLPLA